MTDSTTDNYEQLLRTYPPEKIINASDLAYPGALAYGGCATCAQGQPCRARINEDVDKILCTAGLPEGEKLPGLQCRHRFRRYCKMFKWLMILL